MSVHDLLAGAQRRQGGDAGDAPQTPSTVWPQILFWLVIGGLMAARTGGPLRFAYLVGGVAVGWRLLRTSPVAYVGFVLWLWVLTAFVRRVSDLYANWQDPSMVLLTPYLVTALSFVPYMGRVLRRGRSPVSDRPLGREVFILAAMGAGVGVPFGFLAWWFDAFLESLNYFTPLLLGLYIATQSDHLRAIERRVVTTFQRAAMVAGAYGIYQYTTAPPWDTSWMINAEMGTIGLPEPFGIRVFSTMHSPGALAPFLGMALLLWIAKPRARDIPAAGIAGVTLLLSNVRSAWVACLVGVLFLVAALRPAQRLRVGLTVGLAIVLAGPLFVTPEMAERFDARIATFGQLGEDSSARARITGHQLALDLVTRRPLGLGMGQISRTIESYISIRDSTIVAALVQFGLVGSLFYFMALWLVFMQIWKYYRRAASADSVGLACGGLALLAMAPLGVVAAGPTGMLFWLVAGLAIADRHLARVGVTRVVPVAQRAWRSAVPPHDPAPA
ncbi:MAG: hypothetical protein GEV06_11650 [Luteitalea sp.]|nr:hypothetical protein [Luteitalea sp.]